MYVLRNLLLSLVFLSSSAEAASIRAINPQPRSNITSWARIEITGPIEAGDEQRLRLLLRGSLERSKVRQNQLPEFYNRPVIVIDSPGGDLTEAMRMGRLLRQWRAGVIVPQVATCASACVLVLAGGSSRNVFGPSPPAQSKIGIHRMRPGDASFSAMPADQAIEEYNRVRRAVQDYLSEMGVSLLLHERMFSVASGDVYWLPRSEVSELGVEGEDPGYEEWIHAKEKEFYGDIWFNQRAAYIRCLNSGKTDSTCREISGWR